MSHYFRTATGVLEFCSQVCSTEPPLLSTTKETEVTSFGSQVIAQVLNHKKVKYPEQRSISGRLLYWDHLQHQLSYLLCPAEEEEGEPTVQRAALPVLAPPETPQPKATFGTPLKNENPGHPVDLDMDDMMVPDEKHDEEEEDDVDEHIELDELEGTPFTYFYLLQKDSPQVLNAEEDEDDDDVILTEEPSPPVNTAKTWRKMKGENKPLPISQSLQMLCLLQLEKKERKKWLAAGRKEIDNLTIPKAITALSPQERTALKEKAQLEGEDFIELPAKVVFTIKPEKYKIRIVGLWDQTKDTYGKITTTDLDTCMLRFILSWAASSRFNTIASLDVTAHF